MLSLNCSHICLSCDYFFFCIIWKCFRDEVVVVVIPPPQKKHGVFSVLILSELCTMSRAYSKFLFSSFFTSATSAVSTTQTSPPNPLLPASVSTTFVQTTIIFQLVWLLAVVSLVLFLFFTLLPTNPSPHKLPAYVMLLTSCRLSHVTLLHKPSSVFSLHLEISNSGHCSLLLLPTSSQTIFQ